jgi:CubicO group peptidase (beta-lactamase class C family)
LLRQTPGLDFAQTNTGFDPTSRMSFVERDPAAFAEAALPIAAPGTRWGYTDGNFALLARIIRDAAGGQARDVLELAQHELWGPLGMQHVTLEFDATGTPMGGGWMFASARDWARFGLLYLDDGVAPGGQRILPPGWVRHAATPTLDTGYGAGFFTNAVAGEVPGWGVPWGLPSAPRDAFFARGYMGQFIVVIPSERMVIARFGMSAFRRETVEGNMDRVVADVLAAVRGSQVAASQP